MIFYFIGKLLANDEGHSVTDWLTDGQTDRVKWSNAYFSRNGGDKGLFVTLVPKFSITISLRLLNNFGDFYWKLIGWFIKLSAQTFQH